VLRTSPEQWGCSPMTWSRRRILGESATAAALAGAGTRVGNIGVTVGRTDIKY